MSSIPNTYHGKPLVHSWPYRDTGGHALGAVARYEDGQGRKEVVPFFKPNGTGWNAGAPAEPRPLYGLDTLDARPVLVVEGERCAAALHSLGIPAVTSQGGSSSAHKADWTPLQGRPRVLLLPDNDTPGVAYMQGVAGILSAMSPAPEVLVVDLANLPAEGGDVVDWIMERCPGWDGYGPVPADKHARVAKDLVACLKKARAVPPEWVEEKDEWPEPVPLPEPGDGAEPSPFPADCLPPALGKAAEEVARFVKVDKVAPALVGLSVIATAIGKLAVVVERPGLVHSPTAFFVAIAASGERKSPVFAIMTKPLEDWTELQAPEWEDKSRRAKAKNAAIDSYISAAKREASKKNGKGLEAVANDIEELERQRIPEPPYPSLFATDITEQRLVQKMAARGGAYAVMSGEGRPVIDSILGKYSGDGHTGESVYLGGTSGDTVTRDRVGKEGGPEEVVMRRPCLVVCIMVQPDKYAQLSAHAALNGSGLIARIWAASMAAKAGTRIEAKDEAGLSKKDLEGYEGLVAGLLERRTPEGKPEPHKATLSWSAAEMRREFANMVEALMREGGDLEDAKDIASKAVSQTCRLALVLHVAERPAVLDEPASEISGETWARAQSLGTWFLTEAVRVRRVSQESAELEPARRVMRWLQRTGTKKFSRAFLMQNGPRPRLKADAATKVLALLEEHGLARTVRQPGRKKPDYLVSPKISHFSHFSQGRG